MTTEEKAKAYDNIIEKANKMHSENCEACQICIEELIPELAESEDEKIRGAIIDHLKDSNLTEWAAWLEKQGESDETKAKTILINKGYPIDANGTFPTYEEMYDIIKEGLEKQGEQKPTIEMKSAEESLGIDSDTYSKIVDECIYGEQKPADKVEPKFKVGQTIKKEGFNLGFPIVKIENGFYYNDIGDNFPFTDQDNWKLVEQKPADWSEEDEKMFNRCVKTMKGAYYLYGEALYWLKNRFKSLRPQPKKKEWSEEDKDYYNAIITKLEVTQDDAGLTDNQMDFLKSFIPQTQWKPSDEQMKALDDVISSKDIKYDVLSELYKDLKKLREE